MNIKIPSNSVSPKYYHFSGFDLSDVDNITLFIKDGENDTTDTLPFRVGQIRYFKRGTKFKAAVYRRTPDVFEYCFFGKDEKAALSTIQFETYIGHVADLVEMLYKHNFSDATEMEFINHFQLICKNLYTGNPFLQRRMDFDVEEKKESPFKKVEKVY